MTSRLSIPPTLTRWSLKGVRAPACLLSGPIGSLDAEGLVTIDLTVADGRIESIAPASTEPAPGPAFHQPGLVVPAFVDAHVHLDKGHISPRAPNVSATFTESRETVPLDRDANWTAADVRARMEFAVAAAYAYGTRAMRTHIDSVGAQTRISWPVFAAVRDAWRDKVDLQASPLFPIDLALDDGHMRDVTEMVYAHGECLGAVTFPGPALKPGLDRLFRLAGDKGWSLDFHSDETNDVTINTLALIARTAIEQRFQGRILVGHCCTLALLPDEARERTIELVAEAGISIVSLPMCNMYLQDRRAGETPRWRGVTALHELKAAGVPVMIASDNTRDPFYAYGDLDMAEVWREGTRIGHLDHPFGDWAKTIAALPAEAIGLEEPAVLKAGAPADFVIFPARTLSEFMARPQTTRTVVRGGRAIDAAVPDFQALDHLKRLRP